MVGIRKYFEDNARWWVLNAYKAAGYDYPTAFHRARIVLKFISGLNKKKLNIIDLGCGGGNLTFQLARAGYAILGVDQSQKMIDLAESRRRELSEKIQGRVQFSLGTIDEKMNFGKKFDIVVAMGLIGYLPNDKILFKIANNLLKPNGYLLVSCRNRLFNMVSISKNTEKEIKNNEALKLIKELKSLYVSVSEEDANKFVKSFKKIAVNLPEKMSFGKKSALFTFEKHVSRVSALNSESRQSTPQQLKRIALKYGFKHKIYYGVHPHLMDPNLNKILPPGVFNKISGCLEVLEHLPISLVWSSVFIGAFQKLK